MSPAIISRGWKKINHSYFLHAESSIYSIDLLDRMDSILLQEQLLTKGNMFSAVYFQKCVKYARGRRVKKGRKFKDYTYRNRSMYR